MRRVCVCVEGVIKPEDVWQGFMCTSMYVCVCTCVVMKPGEHFAGVCVCVWWWVCGVEVQA